MPNGTEDNDPSVTFPVWILGAPWSSVREPAELIADLGQLTAPDGSEAVMIFTDESAAKKFLSTYGDGPEENRVPKLIEPKELVMLLDFLAEEARFTNVYIGRADGFSMPTITEVRFNVALHIDQ
jgi:hypothetical protein